MELNQVKQQAVSAHRRGMSPFTKSSPIWSRTGTKMCWVYTPVVHTKNMWRTYTVTNKSDSKWHSLLWKSKQLFVKLDLRLCLVLFPIFVVCWSYCDPHYCLTPCLTNVRVRQVKVYLLRSCQMITTCPTPWPASSGHYEYPCTHFSLCTSSSIPCLLSLRLSPSLLRGKQRKQGRDTRREESRQQELNVMRHIYFGAVI